jgi:hypothetical protein
MGLLHQVPSSGFLEDHEDLWTCGGVTRYLSGIYHWRLL